MTTTDVGLLNEREAATLLHISVHALRKWRTRIQGPTYVKVGRTVRYSPDALIAYVQARTVTVKNRLPHTTVTPSAC